MAIFCDEEQSETRNHTDSAKLFFAIGYGYLGRQSPRTGQEKTERISGRPSLAPLACKQGSVAPTSLWPPDGKLPSRPWRRCAKPSCSAACASPRP